MFEHGFFGNVLSKYYESDSVINSSDVALNTIKAGEFFLCVGAALLIGFLISLIYIVTHRKDHNPSSPSISQETADQPAPSHNDYPPVIAS